MTNREKRRLAAQKAAPARCGGIGGHPEHNQLRRRVDSDATTTRTTFQPPNPSPWETSFRRFLDDARCRPGGAVALDVQIILADQMPGLILAGLAARDRNAERLMLAVGQWLEVAAVAKPGAGLLCGNHDCSTEFAGARLPGAFMITQAFGGADQAIVSGLCAACVERAAGAGGLRDLAVTWWRKVMPDTLPMADGGRA